MADPHGHPQLSQLTKEDLKNLAKQQMKAKRDEEAKTAKIKPQTYASMGSSVCFDAPVKVSGADDHKKLMDKVLGPYEFGVSAISSSTKTYGIFGVERQPSTPLPAKTSGKDFFPPGANSRNRTTVTKTLYTDGKGNTEATHKPKDESKDSKPSASELQSASKDHRTKISASTSGHSADIKPKTTASSVHGSLSSASSKDVHNSSSSSGDKSSRTSSNPHRHDQKKDLSSKSSSANSSSNNNTIKKPVHSSNPNSQNSNNQKSSKPENSLNQSHSSLSEKHREPVLSTMQDLISHSQSKSKPSSNQSQLSVATASAKNSTNQEVRKIGDKTELKPSSVPDPHGSVLKVKEENRNGTVHNGARHPNRPRLTLPEKNVEDMLSEFHIPQPLTGIQTPFKDIKFPFSEHIKDHKEGTQTAGNRGKDMPPTSASRNIMPTKVEITDSRQKVVEEIQEKDDTSDDDADADDDSSESSGSNSEEEGEKTQDGTAERENHTPAERVRIASKQPQETEEKVPVAPPVAISSGQTIPMKEPRAKMSCSSSESSGSESDSIGSTSDSDSDNEQSEDEHPDSPVHPPPSAQKIPPVKSKSSPEYMDTTPSPSGKKWGLKEFLIKDPKPSSLEAPASNKSEQDPLDEVMVELKRGADHISDENPPSVDGILKHYSGEEFSPPAPIDKYSVLSPIKSPQFKTKSPAKRTGHRLSQAEKLQNATKIGAESSVPYHNNTYDIIKNRERKPSITEPDEPVKTKQRRGRKPKMKVPTSKKIIDNDSSDAESESELDVVNCSLSSENVFSPVKSLPKSPKKPYHYKNHSDVSCTDKPLSNTSKKKESKREKRLKTEDSVKLKKGFVDSVDSFNQTISCDNVSKGLSSVSVKTEPGLSMESDSIEDMLGLATSIGIEKPLSPIPNDVNDNKSMCHSHESLQNAGLDVASIKPPCPLNGSVSYINGRASVLVKIDLNLLQNFLSIDSNSERFLKSLSPDKDSSKHQKLLTSAKMGLANKSINKVLDNEFCENKSKQSPSISKSSARNDAHHNSASDKNNENLNLFEKLSNEYVLKPNVCHKPNKENITGLEDTLPYGSQSARLSSESESESSGSSSSSSSESEIEESKTSRQSSQSSFIHSTNNPSPPLEKKKKRKSESHGAADYKRRKTLPSPQQHLLPEATKHWPGDEESSNHAISNNNNNISSRTGSGEKRERCNSSSSQLSTHSTHSTHSQYSSHSGTRQPYNTSTNHGHSDTTTPGHKSTSRSSTPGANSHTPNSHTPNSNSSSNKPHKKQRVKPSPATTPSSLTSATQPSHDLKAASNTTPSSQSHDKSAPSSSIGKKHKSELLDVSKQNGYTSQTTTSSSSTPGNHTPSRPVQGYMYNRQLEEQKLPLPEDSKSQGQKYKYQADAMEKHLVAKYILYLEAVKCFLQSGYAREKNHKDPGQLYLETNKLVSHSFYQLRLLHDTDNTDKSHIKLTVLCLRIQSLVYLKLYLLRKNENRKLKGIIDDYHNKSIKSSSQPKLPSAPSPHQTNWNRSTGTPSPMSPTPSPANSVCSVGSVGSDQTPIKLSNGTGNSGTVAPIAPPGSVIVPQRIHTITQKYLTSTHYLIQAHDIWEQADHDTVKYDIKKFFAHIDYECGPLSLHSSFLHLVRYMKQTLARINK